MPRSRTAPVFCRDAGLPLQCTTLVLILTGIYLLVGLATFVAFLLTQNVGWVDDFFRVPGAMLFVSMSLLQLGFALLVWKQFGPGEPMRTAWGLIVCAAACELFGSLAVHIFAAESPLNLLRSYAFWSASTGTAIRQVGTTIGNTCRFALLAGGMYYALRVYRRSGFLGKLRFPDRVVLAMLALYVVWEFVDLGLALRQGKQPGWAEMAEWPVDPLLWVLLLEAGVLYRSVQLMGLGWVGRCWMAFAIGIALVSAGDISLWAAAYGYLPWPWSALEWYVWLPASAAFAVAPAYQLEAMRSAAEGIVLRERPPSR